MEVVGPGEDKGPWALPLLPQSRLCQPFFGSVYKVAPRASRVSAMHTARGQSALTQLKRVVWSADNKRVLL